MLVAREVKGELARVYPARACCRRAELVGLTYGDSALHYVRDREAEGLVELLTLDHATARITLHLAADLGALGTMPPPAAGARRRRHLRVVVDRSAIDGWSWTDAPACDRRAFVRGLLLGGGSISLSARGPHVEFVFRDAGRAEELLRRLRESEIGASLLRRRGRRVVYIKGQEDVATLLRLAGANRGLLDFETDRVGREVRNRLNRLLNAEAANVNRTVAAAARQVRAIERLTAAGLLDRLPQALREAAAVRRRQPEADLDAVAARLAVSRSAANGRLRRLVELGEAVEELGEPPADATSPRRR
jgi:DNA-binding transcriptional regulator WhiA